MLGWITIWIYKELASKSILTNQKTALNFFRLRLTHLKSHPKMYKIMTINCINMMQLWLSFKKHNVCLKYSMLLSIISCYSLLPFSSIMANEIETLNITTAKTNDAQISNVASFVINNGSNPYKHILSDIEAELASQSYSRINSIIR